MCLGYSGVFGCVFILVNKKGDAPGGPPHERVLPALPGVELNLPHVRFVRAGLHGVTRAFEDAHVSVLHVFLGYPGQRGDVRL